MFFEKLRNCPGGHIRTKISGECTSFECATRRIFCDMLLGTEKKRAQKLSIPEEVLVASRRIRVACNVLFFAKPLLEIRADDEHLQKLIGKIRATFPFASEKTMEKVTDLREMCSRLPFRLV